MNVRIAGMGWVTPLGSDIGEVWSQLLSGKQAVPQPFDLENEEHGSACRVPATAVGNLPSHPRLRRASAISRFAASAGLSALSSAGIHMEPGLAGRTAIIFAIANGGVVYTRRFYNDIVSTGARAASPLLFPETVFNAPASHLAAVLGIAGITYTLVGDGAVGILAIKMATDLLENDAADRCLVVGAEEADPLVFRAYRKWRLCRKAPPMAVYEQSPRGMILSEGAGALLLHRGEGVAIGDVDPGANFNRRNELPALLSNILSRISQPNADALVTSANGTFIDRAEQQAIASVGGNTQVFAPKVLLGESVGASALWQTIAAAQILLTQQMPGSATQTTRFTNVAVLTSGLNQQAAGLRLAVAL